MQKLPEAELDIMLALWNSDTQPVARTYFEQALAHRSWSVNTINTLLSRLQDRGFVHCERQGRVNYYRPAIGREQYLEFEGTSVLQRLYNSSVKNFVAALAHSDQLTEQTIDELQAYLNDLKRRNSHE